MASIRSSRFFATNFNPLLYVSVESKRIFSGTLTSNWGWGHGCAICLTWPLSATRWYYIITRALSQLTRMRFPVMSQANCSRRPRTTPEMDRGFESWTPNRSHKLPGHQLLTFSESAIPSSMTAAFQSSCLESIFRDLAFCRVGGEYVSALRKK